MLQDINDSIKNLKNGDNNRNMNYIYTNQMVYYNIDKVKIWEYLSIKVVKLILWVFV